MTTRTSTFTVLLFGPAAELIGAETVSIELDSTAPTVHDLENALVQARPSLQELVEAGRFAVNTQIVRRETRISPEDEIALISMVSGG